MLSMAALACRRDTMGSLPGVFVWRTVFGECRISLWIFIALLLDEVIVNFSWKLHQEYVVTAEFTMRLHHPA